MTLADAIREGYKRGIYRWELRPKTTDGLVKFYIHGCDQDSVTLDFTLDQNFAGVEVLEPDAHNASVKWHDK
jgi:hypothetical protein